MFKMACWKLFSPVRLHASPKGKEKNNNRELDKKGPSNAGEQASHRRPFPYVPSGNLISVHGRVSHREDDRPGTQMGLLPKTQPG